MNGLTKALAAEFIGTFALIFLGAGTATALGGARHGIAAAVSPFLPHLLLGRADHRATRPDVLGAHASPIPVQHVPMTTPNWSRRGETLLSGRGGTHSCRQN